MAAVLAAIDLTKLHISDDASHAAVPRDAAPTTDAAAPRNEAAWAWYASIGSPKLFVAPLVGYSEPAFRVLCRRLGAQCCSTPMIDAAGYAASPRYRAEYAFSGGAADRPLTAQLGGSDPAALARAAALVAATGHCDAVELNMGCPQRCAKKTASGAFLMEDPARAVACVEAMRAALDAHNATRPAGAPKVACVVKIRCFDDVPRTLALAAALERAGAQMLTVHGRTRHAGGGRRTAAQLANWDWIRAVKERAGIPVISNGNVRHAADVAACFEATGADGVMSGVGCLRRPHAVFTAHAVSSRRDVAAMYCDAAAATSATPRQVHAHLVGKLALTSAAALRRAPDLKALLGALDTAHPWATTGTTPAALAKIFRDLPDDGGDDDRASDDEHGTPVDDGCGGWQKVWRDKRF